MDYQVDLAIFRGPLDLLLYLVRRDEVDICDIPIAHVTEQFLEYLRLLRFIDVEHAGDFLVMAATLMEIKSRMLLPRSEQADDDADDPRRELVQQLLEYKRFKEAAALLETQAERQLSRFPRQPADAATPGGLADQPLRQIELWDLVSAFGRLMQETLALQPQEIVADHTPVQVYLDNLQSMLSHGRRLTFLELFSPPHNRGRLLGLFLALLELIKARHFVVEQPEAFGPIWVQAAPEPPEEFG